MIRPRVHSANFCIYLKRRLPPLFSAKAVYGDMSVISCFLSFTIEWQQQLNPTVDQIFIPYESRMTQQVLTV